MVRTHMISLIAVPLTHHRLVYQFHITHYMTCMFDAFKQVFLSEIHDHSAGNTSPDDYSDTVQIRLLNTHIYTTTVSARPRQSPVYVHFTESTACDYNTNCSSHSEPQNFASCPMKFDKIFCGRLRNLVVSKERKTTGTRTHTRSIEEIWTENERWLLAVHIDHHHDMLLLLTALLQPFTLCHDKQQYTTAVGTSSWSQSTIVVVAQRLNVPLNTL